MDSHPKAEWPQLRAELKTSESNAPKASSDAETLQQLLAHSKDASRDELVDMIQQIAGQVADLQDAVGSRPAAKLVEDKSVESEVRWLDARVLFLEQALTDSRSEAQTLRDFVKAYVDELRVDVDDVLDKTDVVRERLNNDLGGLTDSNEALEALVAELRKDHNTSTREIESVIAELFEVADKTRSIAADAHVTAETNAARSADAVSGIQAEVEEVRTEAALAKKAAERSSEDVLAIRSVADLANETANKAKDQADRALDGVAAVRAHTEATRLQADQSAEEVAALRSENENIRDLLERYGSGTEAAEEYSKRAATELNETIEEVARVRAENEAIRALVEQYGRESEQTRARADLSQDGIAAVRADNASIRELVERTRGEAEDAREEAARSAEVAKETRAEALRSAEVAEESRAEAARIAGVVEVTREEVARSVEVAEWAQQEAARIAEIAERAQQEAARSAEVAEETKESAEEVRVLAEKARDKADRSENDVAALQADVEDNTTAIAEELRLILGQIAAIETSVEQNDREVRDEIASSVRRVGVGDLHRQVRDLQGQLDAIAERGSGDDVVEVETTPAPTKRWVAHLDTRPKPEPSLKALPSPDDGASE